MNVMKHEQKTPSDLSLSEDLFYSPSNINYLKKVTAEIASGKSKLSEHKLLIAL
ncbi:MAG: hypothetical protein IJ587_10595 [Synergistaceae bacterium]|nr:hypothetical protein [Synergistaceae bacterium]